MNEEHFLRIGKIVGAHGLHGRLKVYVTTDLRERFTPGESVFMRTGGRYRSCAVEEVTEFKGQIIIVKISGVDDRSAADAMKGYEVFIDRSHAEATRTILDSDEYYYYDILGCEVFLDGASFGSVEDIIKAGSGEILIVADRNGKRHMVPFVKSMVDVEGVRNGRIDIHPVEGLLDL